jgi:soluble lytic murein transglycosylase
MTRYFVATAFAGIALLTAHLMRSQEDDRTIILPARETDVSSTASGELPLFMTLPRDTAGRGEGIALAKQAVQFQADKKYPEAIAAYDRAATKLPQIADWLSVFAASAASFTGDTAEVRTRLGKVDATLASFAWRSRVRAHAESGARGRALEIARAAVKRESPSARADAWSFVMELGPELSAADRASAGRAFLANGETTRGIKELEAAVKGTELSLDRRAEIRYELGRILFFGAKYKEAAAQLNRVPLAHSRAPDARFLLARAQYRAGQQEQGLKTFRSVVDRYPSSSAATRSLYFLADLAHDDGRIGDAAALFQRAASAKTRTGESALAMMRMGGIAFVAKDYKKAAQIFEDYRKQYPNGGYYDQATYWAAQSAERAGEKTRATELLRVLRNKPLVSYYGMLARDEVDAASVSDIPKGPSVDTAAAVQVNAGLDRWQLLRDIGWNEAASIELERAKTRFKDNRSAMYELAEQLHWRGAPHLSISTAQALMAAGGKYDIRLLKMMYPMPYQDLIERESRAKGLDPYFVAALIRQESRFNNNARSAVGAIGLMQVMPATGRLLANKAGVSNVNAVTLTQPETNVKLGTRFLADLMNQYNQRVDVVLIAYNAGPSRASRWRSFPEFGSEELFIERIPFDETRNYVKIVKLNAAIYRALYMEPRTGD